MPHASHSQLHTTGKDASFKVRSMVGLIPLYVVETLEPDIVDTLPGFTRRMQWFIDNRPECREHVETMENAAGKTRRLLSIVTRDKLPRVLRSLLDAAEFLAPYGMRAASQYHRCGSTAWNTGWITSQRSLPWACFGATQTDAGRSGSQCTTC